MSLCGKTPSEACGIMVQGNDKWKTLIQKASNTNYDQILPEIRFDVNMA